MRKGQVTAFIILGILIVAVVGAAFYFRNQLIRSSFQSDRERAAIVPDQIRPVKLYIDHCLETVSNEAVDLAGFQGGYIELPEDNLPSTSANPFSNKLKLSKGSSASVAYWSYKTANGVRVTDIPDQENIEESISSYITVNLNDCLNDLSSFEDQGYNITRNGIGNVDVRMLDNNVEVIVEQPIIIRYKDIDLTINKHYADVQKPLGRFYDLAKQLADNEENTYFLEEKTIDMLVVHDELPYSDTDFSCSPRIWSKSQVERDLKDIIQDNIIALRVRDSNYQLADDANGYFELEELDGRYQDASIRFRYSKDWPTQLEIEPSDGELLKGQNLNQDTGNDLEGFLTSLFCISDYHFVYDIKYPVLVTFSNGDYIFQYATQVIIDNNQPRENLLGEEEVVKTDEICTIRNGGEITIDTVTERPDGSLIPLDNVDVSYKCITTTCNIGTSDRAGKIQAEFPGCVNGVAIGKKEGYGTGKTVFSSTQDIETSLLLKPSYTKKLDVRLIDRNTGQERQPFESEQVVFEFTSPDYSTSAVWPDNKEVKLMPGSYSVNSYVIGSSTWDIQIASREVESCVEVPNGLLGIFGSKKEECRQVDVPGTTLDSAIKGGANFHADIGHAELAFSNNIVLYTIVENIPGTYDGLAQVYENIETNSQNPRFRYPRFE